MIYLNLTNKPADEVENKAVVLVVLQDKRPLKGVPGWVDWRMNGQLSKLLLSSRFSGKQGEYLLLPPWSRLTAEELWICGFGKQEELREASVLHFLNNLMERLAKKQTYSFAISLSSLTPNMFEWRNLIRLFFSHLSGSPQNWVVSLIEPTEYVEDAKKRNLDFSYDVEVCYELVEPS